MMRNGMSQLQLFQKTHTQTFGGRRAGDAKENTSKLQPAPKPCALLGPLRWAPGANSKAAHRPPKRLAQRGWSCCCHLLGRRDGRSAEGCYSLFLLDEPRGELGKGELIPAAGMRVPRDKR